MTTLLRIAPLALFLAACGTTAPCGPSSCTGCCDADGRCNSAPTNLACGAQGAECVACGLGQSCFSGFCTSNSGTGGGSATGGGTATGGGSATGGGAGLTAEQQEWVTAHNTERAAAMPVPNPALPQVSWSTSAASLAADWAARCNFMHRNPNSLGENLFAASNQRSPTEITTSWASEKSDYTYATNTCALGQACGHYTQIVWRSSVGVGCASQTCTTGSPFGSGSWVLTVCNYDPAGNFVGQKPY